MYWGLENKFLYVAFRIEVTFRDDLKKELTNLGTCFFFQNSKGAFVLVTNRHVVDRSYKDQNGKYKNFKIEKIIVKGKSNDNEGRPTQDHEMEITGWLSYAKDPDDDVAVIKDIKVIGPNAKLDYSVGYAMAATEKDFQSSLEVSDFVAFPGYPDWYDRKENRPILRTGTISSDPRFVYSNNKDVKGNCIAYEAFSFGGSSGSPIFALQRGSNGVVVTNNHRRLLFIGINAGHLKDEMGSHSGISYFYKSTVLLEICD